MRLKAYRRAQQDVEYLELLRKRLRLTPGQVRSSIDRYVDLGGTVVKRFSEDAGTARFGKLSPEGFRKLREATAALLERGN
jgi:DNA-binding MarR family transcriptional regulator